MTRRVFSLILTLGLAAATLSHCSPAKPEKASPPRLGFEPIPAALGDGFSGEKAFGHVAALVDLGPRPPASEGYEKALAYLESEFAAIGWSTARQSFNSATPDGPVRFTNLLARHGSAPAAPASLPVIIGGHLDSKKLPGNFVGANDGGSSTGVILELARVLATDPAAAAKVELVLFDGEEAMREHITRSDGLYGSKYFTHQLASRSSLPALGIVLDIVGDPDYPLFRNPETPADFAAAVEKVAAPLDFAKPLVEAPGPIVDDHIPLQESGLPCLHLIGDFTAMDYWHQAGDTLDKVNPEMLEKVGRLTLGFLSEISRPASGSNAAR